MATHGLKLIVNQLNFANFSVRNHLHKSHLAFSLKLHPDQTCLHLANRHAQLKPASLVSTEFPAVAKMLQYVKRTLSITHSCDVALVQVSDLVAEARLRGPVARRRLIVESFIGGANFVALRPIKRKILAVYQHRILPRSVPYYVVIKWACWLKQNFVRQRSGLLRQCKITDQLCLESEIF